MQPIASNSSSSDKKTLVSDDLIEFRNKNRLVINPTTVTIGTASVGGDMKFAGQANQVDARVNKVKNSTFDLKGANVTFQNVGSSNQGIEKVTLGTKEELAKHLSSFYKKQQAVVYKIRGKGAWQISMPIEGVYTTLTIIGEQEKKEKDNLKKLFQDRRISSHETIFAPKEPIKMKEIFVREELKNADEKRAVILGAAGVGKSTFCQMAAINGPMLWSDFDVVFLIKLRNLSGKKRGLTYSYQDLIAEEGGFSLKNYKHLLDQKSLRNRALLILDGYDELPETFECEGVQKAFFKLKEHFPHILITSRPMDVDMDVKARLEIVGFDEPSIQEYIEKFYTALIKNSDFTKQDADGKISALKSQLKAKPIVHSFAQIPINLSLICALFKENESFLHSDTVSISTFYIEAVRWFYKRYQLSQLPSLASDILKKRIRRQRDPRSDRESKKTIDPIAKALEEIAWTAMKKNTLYPSESCINQALEKNNISTDDLTKIGLFSAEDDHPQFIHLTFQEFFAATYLANLYINNPLQATKYFKAIKFDPRYTLTLWMAAGYLSHQEKKKALKIFFNDLFGDPQDLARGYGLILKARCFEECKCPKEIPQHKAFIDEAAESIKATPVQEMNFQLLNQNVRLLHHPSIIKAFQENMTKKGTRLKAISLIGRLVQEKLLIPHEMMLTLSELAFSSATQDAAIRVILQIVKGGRALPKKGIEVLLKVLKDSSLNGYARGDAAEALGEYLKVGGEKAKEVVEVLLKVLKDSSLNGYARSNAAEALGEYLKEGGEKAKEVVEVLFKVLKDSSVDGSVRSKAAYVIIEYLKVEGEKVKEVVEVLLKVLKDSSVEGFVRSNAAYALVGYLKEGGEKVKEVVEVLLKVLKDSSVEGFVRSNAAYALGEYLKLGGEKVKEVVDVFLEVFKDSSVDGSIRRAAAFALGEYLKGGGEKAKEVVEGLLKVLKDSSVDWEVRSVAASPLGEHLKEGGEKVKEVVDVLLEVLKDSSVERLTPLYAASELERSLPEQLVDMVLGNRWSAASALGEYLKGEGEKEKEKEVVDVFLKLHKFLKDCSVKGYALRNVAYTLGEYLKLGGEKAKEVVEGLLKVLKDSSVKGAGRSNAAYALGEYLKGGGEKVKEVVAGLLKVFKDSSVDWKVRSAAAYALGQYLKGEGEKEKEKEVVDVLLKVFKGSSVDESVRRAAAYALGEYLKLGGEKVKEVVGVLLKVFKNSSVDWSVRCDAASALGEYLKLALFPVACYELRPGSNCTKAQPSRRENSRNTQRLAAGIGNFRPAQIYWKGEKVKEVVEELLKVFKNHSGDEKVRDSVARALRKSSSQQLAKMVSDTRSFKLALVVCYLTQKAFTVSEKEITISDNRNKISFPADKNYLKLVNLQKIINSSYSSLVNGIFDHSWQNTSSSSTSSSSSTFNTSKSHDRY
ncbi:HEAT repeat domain-containing protein [Candidatus Neptunochlamydia vexilliferae]|uniref:NACHT domain-containing protein n=1 Tax=Candidatus Neptunichlamydia vexilliferae TaxID=1651774 RepID=A0ABS0B0R8_9BACT|nr:HEAT repeat domain-containing protein [Candidatus Neptunochlamydia vexilliferae]MBF5059988.1 hypothetical protein [Candidatus Neptunochlamydia vexilliferae]